MGNDPGAPQSFDPLIGATLVDRYEVLRRIAEGGMGAVYEARHIVLGKRVAVKVLLEKFHEKTELVARLLQEAQLASGIGHENIVDVNDFGTTADGRSFVVMEFLEGESLAQLVMRDAPLAVERCLTIARQVASALEAAHDKGIVHRDVKPENIFLLRRGEQDFVKVMDFGVSKAVRSREDGAELMRLTRTGMVLGTPLYMSPEQARGDEDVDARADIWAVGVVLFECLTGEVPFRANNYLGVISQVITEDVQPPSRLRPELGIPAAVEAVVMRAMEKERDRRYQRMADLVRDLDRLLAGDQNVGLGDTAAIELPAPEPADRPRWHLIAAAILVVGGGMGLALWQTEQEGSPRTGPTRTQAVAPVTPPGAASGARPATLGEPVRRPSARGAAPAVAPSAAGASREKAPGAAVGGASAETAGAASAETAGGASAETVGGASAETAGGASAASRSADPAASPARPGPALRERPSGADGVAADGRGRGRPRRPGAEAPPTESEGAGEPEPPPGDDVVTKSDEAFARPPARAP